MLSSVGTSEMRENRREPPEELERFFPSFLFALPKLWQSAFCPKHWQLGNAPARLPRSEHLIQAPRLASPRPIGILPTSADTDATRKSTNGDLCLAEIDDALGPRSSRGGDLCS